MNPFLTSLSSTSAGPFAVSREPWIWDTPSDAELTRFRQLRAAHGLARLHDIQLHSWRLQVIIDEPCLLLSWPQLKADVLIQMNRWRNEPQMPFPHPEALLAQVLDDNDLCQRCLVAGFAFGKDWKKSVEAIMSKPLSLEPVGELDDYDIWCVIDVIVENMRCSENAGLWVYSWPTVSVYEGPRERFKWLKIALLEPNNLSWVVSSAKIRWSRIVSL